MSQSSSDSDGASNGAEPASESTGVATGSGGEMAPPIAGGVQPTGAAAGSVPVSPAPEAPVPTVAPEPTEQPDASTPAEPNESPPDAGGAPPSLPEPEPVPACGGVLLAGTCWYLGNVGQACDDVCLTRGGFSTASMAWIGTPAQGGSVEGCTAVLQALAALPGVVTEGFREDGLGLGCHLYVEAAGTEAAWWLTSPDLSPQAFSTQSRQACGCVL